MMNSFNTMLCLCLYRHDRISSYFFSQICIWAHICRYTNFYENRRGCHMVSFLSVALLQSLLVESSAWWLNCVWETGDTCRKPGFANVMVPQVKIVLFVALRGALGCLINQFAHGFLQPDLYIGSYLSICQFYENRRAAAYGPFFSQFLYSYYEVYL